MATTEQRTGFRLPWASDASTKTDSTSPEGDVIDDTPVGAAEGTAVETRVETGFETGFETSAGSDPATELAEESALVEDVVKDSFFTNLAGRAGWDADPLPAIVAPTTTPDEAAVEAPRQQRRVNPLVAGLVRAMVEAAEAARHEVIAGLTDATKTRKEQIQIESTDSEAEARATTDQDIAEIRDWSKAQTARIRGETDVRITNRKRQLETQTGDLSALTQRRIGHVEQTVEAYESQMDAFFQTLFEQDDPAYLAALAQQLPEPPDLADETGLDEWTPTSAIKPTASSQSFAPEMTATFALVANDDDDQVHEILEQQSTIVAQSDATTSELPPSEAEPSTDASPAYDLVGVPAVTLLSVVGLVSVASIAAFKRAVAKAPGVEAISVVSGPAGDFVFTVRHHVDTDVAGIVNGLEEFKAVITNKDEGVLSITATAPAGLN